VVVDASALINLVTAPPGGEARTALARQVELHAPCLLDAEFLSALRHLEMRRELSDADARSGLGYFRALPLRRHELGPLTDRVWELRHNVTTRAAAYVALAERLALPLLTADARLARAPGVRCEVIVA
jgi:predicted nucleic acid-binding protein